MERNARKPVLHAKVLIRTTNNGTSLSWQHGILLIFFVVVRQIAVTWPYVLCRKVKFRFQNRSSHHDIKNENAVLTEFSPYRDEIHFELKWSWYGLL